MAKKILIALMAGMLSVATAFAQPPDTLWTQTFGGSNDDHSYYSDNVHQTNDGGYIIASATASFGAGSDDIWLIKTDENGETLWTRTFGGGNDDHMPSVQQTADGGYIIAGRTVSYGAGGSDVWLIKTSAVGDCTWSQTFGGSGYDCAHHVQQTEDGGYIIAGASMSYGPGGYDVWLIKTDDVGNLVWDQTFGTGSLDAATWVRQTDDGGYIVVGEYNRYGAGGPDAWLIKTDADGNEEWSQTFGGSGTDRGYSVQQTADGGYILTGHTNGDVWLIKTDVNGNTMWTCTFSDGTGYSVQLTDDGGYIITGFTYAGNYDAWLIKTDADGDSLWSCSFGGSEHDIAYSLDLCDDGGCIIAGYTESYGAGGKDVWLIRLGEAGPSLNVLLVPFLSPIQIPAGGGSFEFYAFVTNNEATAQAVDLWTWVIDPNGAISDPLFGPGSITLQPGTTGWYRIQNVPGAAVPGIYSYIGTAGISPGLVWASDTLAFEKLETGDTARVSDWNNWGDPIFDAEVDRPDFRTSEYILNDSYPNPFNPLTTISYELQDASFVNLAVYDINGRIVTEVVNGRRDAGNHQVTFDGSALASGVYLYRIKAGDYTVVKKMVLMK